MRESTANPPATRVARQLIPLLLAAAATAAYSNSLSIPFLYDDQTAVVVNESIRRLSISLTPPLQGAPVSGRPLVNATLALNYAAGGLDARGYHAVNLLIHVLCAVLLFGVVRRTLADTWIAGVAALLWVLHPLGSEAVDYVSARTESLMAMFYLLTLYTHARAMTARRRFAWNAASVAACAAGMACKESMVTAPLIVFLYDAIFGESHASSREASRAESGFSRTRRGIRVASGFSRTSVVSGFSRTRWQYYAALSSTWVVLALLVAGNPRAGSAGFSVDPGLAQPTTVWTYLLNQSLMITRYLRMIVWPRGLVFDYGLPQPMTLASAAPYVGVIAALAAATIVALVWAPRLGFLGAWFFITLAPACSFVPVATEVGAERRMYLPLMAAAILAAIALDRVRARLAQTVTPTAAGAVATVAVAALGVTLGVMTYQRNAEYRTPQSIWQTVVDRRPHGRARYNLAMAFKAEGRRGDAIAMLTEAVRDYPDAHYGLAAELTAAGRTDEAVAHFEQFVAARPSHIAVLAAWTDLGIAYATRHDMARAVVAFERVVAMTPRNANARRNLANALLETGDFDGAIAQARAALELNANDAVSREILELATAGARDRARR